MKQISSHSLLILSAIVGLPAIAFLFVGVSHGMNALVWPFALLVWPAAALVLLILLSIATVQAVKTSDPKQRNTMDLGLAAFALALFTAAWILV